MTKKEEVDVKSGRVTVGLEKLKKGAADVELMKVGWSCHASLGTTSFRCPWGDMITGRA